MFHWTISLILLAFVSSYSHITLAHCDSMDGPVVRDAKTALSNKKIDSVLKWVMPKDEKVVLEAFKREYVQAYVDLTHFVEGVHRIATEGASHKHNEK